MNEIAMLRKMLVSTAQLPLHPSPGRPSVKLTDKQAKTTVEIKGIPHDSVVIRAEDFENPLTIFNGSKGERKRADFVIVAIDGIRKWIICIETQAGNSKTRTHVEQQLKGAACFMSYCNCIGKMFWQSKVFLDDYQYRHVSIVDISSAREIKKTRHYPFYIQPQGGLHNTPAGFLKIYRSDSLYFSKLISEHLSFSPS